LYLPETLATILVILAMMLAGLKVVHEYMKFSKVDMKELNKNQLITKSALQGFILAFVLVGYWALSFVVGILLEPIVGYSFSSLIGILFFMVGLGLTAIFLFIPPIYLLMKRTPLEAIATGAVFVICLLVLAIIAAVLLNLIVLPTISPGNLPGIYY
ncbi:MAG: hypothetical protein Q7K42_03370, partial [Candidatus Diapherotrites archaeon]|nr:hypothetical protein [Candidatus Diapherotrites archaeon]